MTSETRSLAGRVLRDGEVTPDEAQTLAASVLANDTATDTRHTKEDLQRMLRACEGRDGYTDRAKAIRATLDKMEGEE